MSHTLFSYPNVPSLALANDLNMRTKMQEEFDFDFAGSIGGFGMGEKEV